MSLIICCSCDEHYGGDALACAKSIASGTKTPCACDCHKATASTIVPVVELRRLKQIEEAARHYRFAGTEESKRFLSSRGWLPWLPNTEKWFPPKGYPAAEPKSTIVALAIELEVSLGCHKS